MSRKQSKRRGSRATGHGRVGSGGSQGRRGKRPVPVVFTRKNYTLLLIGLALIIVGYVAMRIDNQVEGFISLYVAPLMILGGYLEIIWAIFHKEKSEPESD